MKTLLTSALFLCLLLIDSAALSQPIVENPIKIDGVQVKLQKTGNPKFVIADQPAGAAEIKATFGTPTSVEEHEDDAAGGYMINYHYPDLRISTVDGLVYDFAFDSRQYEVCINNRYKIKIGDTLDAFLSTIPKSEYLRGEIDGRIKLYFKLAGSKEVYESSLVLTVSSTGQVVLIHWDIPV